MLSFSTKVLFTQFLKSLYSHCFFISTKCLHCRHLIFTPTWSSLDHIQALAIISANMVETSSSSTNAKSFHLVVLAFNTNWQNYLFHTLCLLNNMQFYLSLHLFHKISEKEPKVKQIRKSLMSISINESLINFMLFKNILYQILP